MSYRDTALLFLLAGMWGASFLFIRIAVPVLGPFPLVESRVVLGGLILLSYAFLIGQAATMRQHWRLLIFIGVFNNAIPFTLIAAAQLNLTASLAALLNATTPLFSAVIAAVWIKDRLTLPKLSGLLLGIVGVGLIVGWQGTTIDETRVLSIVLVLVASASYGLASVFSKVYLKGVHPVAISTGQLITSSLLILPFALLNPPQAPLTGGVIAAVVALGVVSTSVAYLIYFHLIESAGPTNATSVTLLVPFFSSLWGALILGERLESNELLGFAVILFSLLLVTGIGQRLVKRKRTVVA